MFKKLKYVFCAMALGLLLTSAASWSASTLTGAGATFPYPIYSKWFDAYEKITGVRINYQSIGSGAGIQQIKSHTIDFGASDAPLSNEEVRSMPAPVVHIPTVAGAVVITYNVKGVTAGLKLTPEIVSGMFLGKIKKWDDSAIRKLNPRMRLPRTPIYVAHRSDGSGTSFIFTNYLAAVNRQWKTEVGAGKSVRWPVGIGGKGNEGVAGIVKQTPGAMGYVELAYAVQNHLPYAQLRNRSGQFIMPTIETTTLAAMGGVAAMKKDVRTLVVNSPTKGAYPIVGFTYILLYKNQGNSAKGRELVKFLRWAMRDGQKMAKPLLYAPLPAKVAAINIAALKSIR